MGKKLRKMAFVCLAGALLAAGILSAAQPAQAAIKAWEKVGEKYYNSVGRAVPGVVAKGMDVSEWQSLINWDRVKESGQIEFAFVRVAHGKGMDTWYDRNLAGANRVGIPVGVYFYSEAKTVAQARRDAKTTINAIKGYKITYPVVIDIEDNSQLSLTTSTRTKIVQAFADEVRAAGYQPMVYCNTYWVKQYLNMAGLQGVDAWIAEWSANYTPSIPRDIWQVTDKGKIPGVPGNVDLDFAFKRYSSKPVVKTGWIKSGKGYQYRLSTGKLVKNKFKTINGKKYYLDSAGYRVTGFKTIDGKSYYFDRYGVMKTGWRTINGSKYYFDAKGVMAKNAWQKKSGKWYYLGANGKIKKGWLTDKGKKYYLDSSGVMRTKWYKIKGIWYFFNDSGAMLHDEWVPWKNSWYFLKKNGQMKTGWQAWKGKWYYLKKDGQMKTGWQAWKGEWYYLKKDGQMKKGWLQYKNNYYYLDSSGVMLRNTTRTIDGRTFTFDAEGIRIK